jgi:hypothetical protein
VKITSSKSTIVVAPGCPAELIRELLSGRILPNQAEAVVLLPLGTSQQYDKLMNKPNCLSGTQFVSSPSRRFFSASHLAWLWTNLRSSRNIYLLIIKSPYQDTVVALISLLVLMFSGKAITLLFATPEAVIDLNGQGFSERWISQELNLTILASEITRIFWFLNPWNILYSLMFGGLILRDLLSKHVLSLLRKNMRQENLTDIK